MAREWGFVLFYLHLSSCRTRFILRILSLYINVIFRNSSSSFNYGSSFPWLCSSLGTNVVLRGYGYYKPFICRALRWRHSCSVYEGVLLWTTPRLTDSSLYIS